jgi:hypothetical protein
VGEDFAQRVCGRDEAEHLHARGKSKGAFLI